MSWLKTLQELEDAAAANRQNRQKPPFVGSVSPPPGPEQNSPALAPWPVRLAAQLRAMGVCSDTKASVIELLAVRDEQKDERHLCLECKHLRRFDGVYRCSEGRNPASLFGPGVPSTMLSILHRCRCFKSY